jgi:peptidyl-prolyl cis-trans isomerase B (cyclophilin B)
MKIFNSKRLFLLTVVGTLFLNLTFSQGIDKPRYQILTKRAGVFLGNIEIELFPLIAPNHVHNFDSLALALAFDSTAFHRVVPGFVIQGGDPNSINGPISTWGQGQPSQPTVNAEFSAVRHNRGIIGAARDTNINSASSQFYICVAPAYFLDGNYTVYGKVTSGMDIVDTIVSSPRNVNDVPLQKIEMFVTYLGVNDTIPDAPQQTIPANNATSILPNQSYQWSAVPNALLYTVEFSADSTFTSIYFSKTTSFTFTVSPTFAGFTKYYWRVRSNNGGHESLNSTVFNFTTLSGAPTPVTPLDSSINVVTNPVFTWNTPPGVATYTLQVATGPSFSGTYLFSNQTGLTSSSSQVSGLQTNKRYYWRMRTTVGSANSAWSPIFTFETGTSVGENELIGPTPNFQVSTVFPNPVNEMLNIKFTSRQTGDMDLSIIDMAGKKVISDRLTVSRTDAQQLSIDLTELSSGIYILELILNNEKYSSQIKVE